MPTPPEAKEAAEAWLRSAAERLLWAHLGHATAVERVEVLREAGRSRAGRCWWSDGDGPPSSAVLKILVDDDKPFDRTREDDGSGAWRFYNEWAGVTVLHAAGTEPSLGAAPYAVDSEAGAILIEDLGEGPALSNLLLADDRVAAESALIAYAASLGRLHAATIGREAEFEAARRSIGATRPRGHGVGDWVRHAAREVVARCEPLGVRPADGFEAEIELVTATLDDPGDFLAFAPCDTCPDNNKLARSGDGNMRFFDFEFAQFRHALLDAAYIHVPFPTCWCVNRLPEGMPDRMEAAYRSALAPACAAANDDRVFAMHMACACAAWMLESLNWSLKRSLEEPGRWGIASQRQRHPYRLERFIEVAGRADALPAIVKTAAELRESLMLRWPDEPPMPLYPSFRA